MSKYVIMNRATGRYYTSSKANEVDPFDIHYAKIFPSLRSAKSAIQWFDTFFRNPETKEYEDEYDKGWQPTVYEVETQIILKKPVKV